MEILRRLLIGRTAAKKDFKTSTYIYKNIFKLPHICDQFSHSKNENTGLRSAKTFFPTLMMETSLANMNIRPQMITAALR